MMSWRNVPIMVGKMAIGRARRALAYICVLLLMVETLAGTVLALPQGGRTQAGEAEIAVVDQTMTVRQESERLILEWDAFNVGADESVLFQQPTASAVVLNRVLGSDSSEIFGRVQANGQLFLINPNGVLFGEGARVDAGALVASTLDVSDTDFLAGRYAFAGNGGRIANHGDIFAASGGYVVLLGTEVQNSGTISAPGGGVGLAAGSAATLNLDPDGLLSVVIDGAALGAQVDNGGVIAADGGMVLLTADAIGELLSDVITHEGVIKARALEDRGGVIHLVGGDVGTVRVAGTLDVSAGPSDGAAGGEIVVTGRDVLLEGDALLDAGGETGGVILVGGDRYGGRDPVGKFVDQPVSNAHTTTVAKGALLVADGKTGDGGSVVVWSDDLTTYEGEISARGGDLGNGGFAEVSGKRVLTYRGTADLRGGPSGEAGTLLLDPYNVTITGETTGGALTGGTFTPSGDNSTLSAAQIVAALATANVIVTTGGEGSDGDQDGDIFVETSIEWDGNTTLELSAYRDIWINNQDGAVIKNTGAGHLVLRADNSGTGAGSVIFTNPRGVGVDFSGSTGTITAYYNPDSNTPGGFFNNNDGGKKVNTVSYTDTNPYDGKSLWGFQHEVNVGSEATLYAYMLVNNIFDLQNMQNNLIHNWDHQRLFGYALSKDIDASATADAGGWMDSYYDPDPYDGFAPIGGLWLGGFMGLFDGQGYVIDGLYINRDGIDHSGLNYVGLFGALGQLDHPDPDWPTAKVSRVGLTNADIRGQMYVGGLVGKNAQGTIEQAYVTGSVTGIADYVGGLVGENSEGTIEQSYVSGSVAAIYGGNVGGLVGYNGGGTIEQSYANGSVTGAGYGVGGLVGYNDWGTIEQSYFTGNVTGAGEGWTVFGVGGLVGDNSFGTIKQAHVTGDVTGVGDYYGGLVGYNFGGTIEQTYAEGRVTVTGDSVGGLVGENAGRIVQSFSTAAVMGVNSVGGLVGSTYYYSWFDVPEIAQSYAAGPVHGTENVGGLVGLLYGGDIDQAYAIGAVTGTTAVGGLVGLIDTTEDYSISHAFYNEATTGADFAYGGASSGEVTGVTITAVGGDGQPDPLVAATYDIADDDGAFDFGADSPVWGIDANVSYPYLTWRFPNGPSVVSGTISGVAGGNGSLGVTIGKDGAVAFDGYAGANGAYYVALDPAAADSAVLAWLSGTRFNAADIMDRGNAVTDFGADGHATGLDLVAGELRVTTGLATLGSVMEKATGTLDDDPALDGLVAFALDADNLTLDADLSLVATATAASFTLDRNVAAFGSGAVSVTGGGNVILGNNRKVTSGTGVVTFLVAGDLTLMAGSLVESGATDDAIVLSTLGNFVNQSGPEALHLSDGGARWLVYVADLDDNTYGGLNSGNTAIWNASYATLAPADVTSSGNRYLFNHRPTLTFAPNDYAKTYGVDATADLATSAPHLYSVTGFHPGVDGVFSADKTEGAYTGAPTMESAGAKASVHVKDGGYAIVISKGTLFSEDYDLAFDVGTLTVIPRAITVTAQADTKTYDGTIGSSGKPMLAAETPLVDGDSLPDLVQVFDSRDAGDDRTLSVIPFTVNDGNGGKNYIVTLVTAKGTINRRSITISAVADTKTYDGTIGSSGKPMLAAETPLADGDSLPDLVQVFDSRDAGTRSLLVTSFAVNDGNGGNNYIVTRLAAAGAIDKRPLTVKADDVSKVYAQAMPGFTVAITGFAPGESLATLGGTLVFITTATEDSLPESYPITPSGLTSPNYDIHYVPGTLTIVVPEDAYEEALTYVQNVTQGTESVEDLCASGGGGADWWQTNFIPSEACGVAGQELIVGE